MYQASRFAVAVLAILAGVARTGAAAEAKRPNIVFIFSDDHAYQAISAYGDSRKLLDTPNIDRIGREGMRFDRCLVPNSICGPSRATILTGLYSHLNGFYNNSNSRFDSSQTTFPKLLKGAGYQTAIIGKWHLISEPTGFDHWQILPGQGIYYNPAMIRNGEKIVEQGYVTDIITERSVEWLKGRDKTKPFVLMAQHKAPHREWSPPIRHLGHNGDRKYAEPETLFDDYARRGVAEQDQDMTIAKTMTRGDLKLNGPPNELNEEQRAKWNAYYGPRNEQFRKDNPQGDDLVRWKYQRYMHDYLGCVKAVDESVGAILKCLADEGLADNTIVVYSSDQGFYLGEHGWFDKRWIFEESLKTPLLVRWPGTVKPGSVNGEIVSNVDFAQTFLAAAGVEAPQSMQGRSLVPLLAGATPADWRKSFYYQYYEYPVPHHVRPHHGVVTDRYKLVRFDSEDAKHTELFDLKEDPSELRNVADESDYAPVKKELEVELARLRTELKVPETIPPEATGGQRPAADRPAGKTGQGTTGEGSTNQGKAGQFFFTSQGKTGLASAAGGELRWFDFKVPGQATWQPGSSFSDGRRVVFLSMEPRRDGPGKPFEKFYTQTPTHIWVHDLQTGSLDEICNKDRIAPFETPALLVSDERILVQVVKDGVGQIVSMALDGTDAKDFTRPGEGLPYGLSISPDGRRVAFHLAGPQGYQVWTSDADGGNRVRVAGDPKHLFFGTSWSHDGKWILYVDCHYQSDPGHDWADVCIGRADGSEHRVLTKDQPMWFAAAYGDLKTRGGGSNLPAWTHDGKILFPRRAPDAVLPWQYSVGRVDVDHFNRDFKPDAARGGCVICRLDPSDGSQTALTPADSAIWDFRASESTDGRQIVFCRAKTGGGPAIWVMDSDGSNAREITRGQDDLGADHPRWLPTTKAR